jgi:serine protease Do
MKIILIIFLCLSGSLNLYAKISGNPKLYSDIKPYVFQVKTSQDANASKSSYGTGFVVHKDGLLITNYHVISTVVQDKFNRYKIFAVDKENYYEAKVIDFNIINDLALIKIEKKFDQVMTLNSNLPKRGEQIYSIGLPKDLNMSIVEGTFNGEIKRGIYERFLMSTPVNSGMSGGPSVNTEGEVMGINVSILRDSENISFSVPAVKAIELLENYNLKKDFLKRKDYDSYIEKQLNSIEVSLLKSMKSNLSKSKNVGGFEVAAPSNDLKCWTANDKSRKNTFKYYKQSCRLKSSAYIKRSLYSGTYQLSYTALHNIKRNKLQFTSAMKYYLNSNHIDTGYLFSKISREELTKYSCNEDIMVNDNKISFKVTYCLNTYLRYKNIYRLFFKAATIENNKKGLVIKLSVDGFSQEGVFDFIKYHMNNIKSLN